jgi:hypothetical protein
MAAYYAREVDIYLMNYGNNANAVMHWFDDGSNGEDFSEWNEEVIVHDIKMMSEKDIEEAIKEKLQNIVEREFDADRLVFIWKVK